MNIFVIVAILLALTGFKPAVNGDKGQVTQGYYDPQPSWDRDNYWDKKKMNTTSSISDSSLVEPGTYFRADLRGDSYVWYKFPAGHNQAVVPYNPLHYTTENMT